MPSIKGKLRGHTRSGEHRNTMARKLLNSRRWRAVSRAYLEQHPLCEDCGRPSQEAHHVVKRAIAPHLAYHESNLMALCRACHRIRTERGE